MRTLVISVRGFHLGYLGCCGNEWISTPALDRLAADGIVFDQHIADVPEASAARRAWRSGRYQFPPLDRKDTAAQGVDTSRPGGPDLIEELRCHGVRTVLVADASRPLPEGFAAGWDRVEVVRSLAGEATFLEQTLEAARAALTQLAGLDRWLLWVDLATLLPPWEVPAEFSDPYFQELEHEEESDEDEEEDLEEEGEPDEEFYEETEEASDEEPPGEEFIDIEDSEEEGPPGGFEEDTEEEDEEEPLTPWFDPLPGFLDREDDTDFLRLQSSYAAAVSFVDAAIDSLLNELAGLGLADDCLVVLTSDHGQALGEHGIVGPYRPWLHDELVHVPCCCVCRRDPLARLPRRARVRCGTSAYTP
ncbi:MAG: sulfatase-like hydrolase/transferase [Planctomycetes bacterium]|nr:sulfatase-like hydrolase/transferase [Planctomycetota bacterium]